MKEIEALWSEVRELSLGNSAIVERLESPPTPLQFLRDFVFPNKPCIIPNAINHWPALSSWTHDSYLTQALSSASVSLHLTPNGRADAIFPFSSPHGSAPVSASSSSAETAASSTAPTLCFASAHVERLPFPAALRLISSGSADYSSNQKFVAYAQQQNDCFRLEYSALDADCDPQIDWATEALGCVPEAVNLWIGNQHSETSFHKDHYENIYAVVTGEKHFLLLPPTDVHRLYIRDYPAANYRYSWVLNFFSLMPQLHLQSSSSPPLPSIFCFFSSFVLKLGSLSLLFDSSVMICRILESSLWNLRSQRDMYLGAV